MTQDLSEILGRRLVWFGILLFLLGLVTGLATGAMANPRLGLSSHLEGVMNGMFLVILGLVWPKLVLSDRMLKVGFGLALFGTYVNWATTLLAGLWGAGSALMPIAGGGKSGTAFQEAVVSTGLITLAVAMIAACIVVLWGLRDTPVQTG